ncbi:hypothetical protein M569_15417 [Genlisea aurea]|uniref:Inositol-tetrakisphosphate 1-kinase n=1 Tax=Genlisea aurea TaxID=192259 RepID=S8C4T2_9LAMI|nr:hypothetical protein M569_15417 [Genlisea aurea]
MENRETEEEEREKTVAIGFSPATKVAVVGYALTSKKVQSFLQPNFEKLARNRGIIFVAIDQGRSLMDQGPFDVVLHKLSGKEWRRMLEEYRCVHPEVTVLDPPSAIQQLHSRQYMLRDVANLNLSEPCGKVGVPKQLVIIKRDPFSIPDGVKKAGLKLPLVAKPLIAKSHDLSIAYDEFALQKLEPPLLLQEFINHGGILFKVFVVGEAVKVLRRFSLPDVVGSINSGGVRRLPRVSSAASSLDDVDLDPRVADSKIHV